MENSCKAFFSASSTDLNPSIKIFLVGTGASKFGKVLKPFCPVKYATGVPCRFPLVDD